MLELAKIFIINNILLLKQDSNSDENIAENRIINIEDDNNISATVKKKN